MQQQHYYHAQQVEAHTMSSSLNSDIKTLNDLNNNNNSIMTKQEPDHDPIVIKKLCPPRNKKPKLDKQTTQNENTDNSLSADENEPSVYSSNQSYSNQSFIQAKFYPQPLPQQNSDQIYPWMKDSRQHNLNFNDAQMTTPTEAISPQRNSFSVQMIQKTDLANNTMSSSPATSNPSDSILIQTTPNLKTSSKGYGFFFIYLILLSISTSSNSNRRKLI